MYVIRAGTVILVLALAAVGCGGGEDGGSQADATTENRSAEPVEGVGATEDPEAPEETDTVPEEETEESSGEALASREGQIDGEPVLLEVTELRRSGGTTALTLRLSVGEPSAGEDEASAQIAQTFDDGLGEATGGQGQDSFTLDGVSLVDNQNRQRYLVARDSQGVCVCDGNLSGKFVEPGAPSVLSATFGAPPADVEALDVVIPSFGTFKDVPLS